MNQELKKHIIGLLDKGTRLDGRGLTDYRKPVKVDYDFSKNAEGSAQVTIGDTVVLTGVKLSLEAPYPDTPDKGNLMVGAELLPMSNSEFELGPPSIQAIEVARVVDRGIRESHSIDVKKLCIEPGVKVWGLAIDICPINESGNLFDAAALSAIAALKSAKFRPIKDGNVDYDGKKVESIPLLAVPVSVTVCKIGKHFLVDPISDEEKVIDARLTVASNEKGQLCALQKGGDDPLSAEDLDLMVEIGLDKGKELRKALG